MQPAEDPVPRIPDIGRIGKDVALTPIANELRGLAGASQSAEHLFRLGDMNEILVAVQHQNRRGDLHYRKEQAVADIAIQMLPWWPGQPPASFAHLGMVRIASELVVIAKSGIELFAVADQVCRGSQSDSQFERILFLPTMPELPNRPSSRQKRECSTRQ